MEQDQYLQEAEQAGRATDDTLAHLTTGEIVIPLDLQSDSQVVEMLSGLFQQGGLNIAEFTVGDLANKINPETGYPEFFSLGKAFKNITKTAANLVPTSLMQKYLPGGDVIIPALTTAIGGPVAGGLQSGIYNYGQTGKLGDSLKTAAIVGSTGALANGIAGNDILSGAGFNDGILGTPAGTPVANGVGPTQGSGIRGAISGGNFSSGTATGGGGSSFSGGNLLSNVLSAGLGTKANDDAEKALLEAQGKALGVITPFEDTQFTQEDLQNDPGYQFRLAEGEKALSRSQAARGNFFSGAALKAAQDYGQGLADTSYNEANSRFNNDRNFKYGVATDKAGVFGNQGNIKANTGINNSNVLSGALSGVLGGGVNNVGQSTRKILGYNPQTGEPIYG